MQLRRGRDPEFSAELDAYVVCKLELVRYRGSDRRLPDGYDFAEPTARRRVRHQERRLLCHCFRHWEAPWHGRLHGWRPESPIHVIRGDRLVGGIYLCDATEFDDDLRWGQLHYAFMDPQERGRGVYSAIFGAAVERARNWGLEGLYMNTDRHRHAEVYERWGAEICKRIPKARRRRSPLVAIRRRLVGLTGTIR